MAARVIARTRPSRCSGRRARHSSTSGQFPGSGEPFCRAVPSRRPRGPGAEIRLARSRLTATVTAARIPRGWEWRALQLSVDVLRGGRDLVQETHVPAARRIRSDRARAVARRRRRRCDEAARGNRRWNAFRLLHTPHSLRTGPVVAIVQLSGAPIAQVEAQDPTSQLSASEKAQIRADLVARQNAISPPSRVSADRSAATSRTPTTESAYGSPGTSWPLSGALPNVTAVHVSRLIERDNAVSVPYLGVPAVEHAVLLPRPEPEDRGHRHRYRLHAHFRAPGTVATPAEYAAATPPTRSCRTPR